MITYTWICRLLILLFTLYPNIPMVTAMPNFLESLQGNYDPNSLNSDGQSPCAIAYAIHANNSGAGTAETMAISVEWGNVTVYYGTSTTCNLVMYNLWSGCLAQTCDMVFSLSNDWLSYDTFKEPCKDQAIPSDSLPDTVHVPSNMAIPRWAYDTPLSETGYFNYPQALFIAQKWTTLQKLTPVIAVLLTLVIVLFISLIYCCVAQRWTRKRRTDPLRKFGLNPHTSMDTQRWNPWPGRLASTVSSLSSRPARGSRNTHRRVYSEPRDESLPEDGWVVRLRRRLGIALSRLPWNQTITVVRQRSPTGFGIDGSTVDYRPNPYYRRSIIGGLDTDRLYPSPPTTVLNIVPDLPNPHLEMQPLAHEQDQGVEPSTQQCLDRTLTHQAPQASFPHTHTPHLHHTPRHVATPPPPYDKLAPHIRAPSVALADSPTIPVSDNAVTRPIGVLGLDTRISSSDVHPDSVYTQNIQPQPSTPIVRIPPARESSSLLPPELPTNPWIQPSSHEASIESPSSSLRRLMIENRRLPTPTYGPQETHQCQLLYPSSLAPRRNQPRHTNAPSQLTHFRHHLGTVGRPASTESLLMNPPETPLNFD